MKELDNLLIERGLGLAEATEIFERWYSFWALKQNSFNQTHAAKELKTHRNNLVRRIHDWGLTEKVHRGYLGEKVEL